MLRIVIATALAGIGLAACGKNQDPPPPTTGVPNAQRESGWMATAPKDPPAGAPAAAGGDATAQARAMYDTVCVMCHGPSGRGDGRAASMLKTKPRDYGDAAWQAQVTDDELAKAIVGGGAAVGKSPEMPAQPQLAKQPEVLKAMVALVRSFKAS